MWACGVRRVVSECSMVLLIAVKTAVTWWQPGALRDDRGGSPLDPRSTQPCSLAFGFRRHPASQCAAGVGCRLRCR